MSETRTTDDRGGTAEADASPGPAGGREEASPVLLARLEKLEALRDRGIRPYAYGYERTHRAGEARALFEDVEGKGELDEDDRGPAVRIAGRMVAYRSHGRSAFADVEDPSGRIQVYFRRD
ncbi:MAG TPA: OB-fold nucleic acid binding domain-containing protein, partial [Longimicrobiales bacterium]|nr:OB-fold nucleic acid binding domain-containing protein [Longimicrobiales bacterium]